MLKTLRLILIIPFNNQVKSYNSYTLTFDEDKGDGVRIIGAPGGTEYYTSIAELEFISNNFFRLNEDRRNAIITWQKQQNSQG